MTAVAGHFYDYVVGDDRQSGLLIADVSGHGVSRRSVGDELGAYWKLAESVGKGGIRPAKRVSTTTVLRRGRALSFAAVAEWWRNRN